MKLDIPFIQEVFDSVVNKSNYNVDKLVGTYIVELQKRTTKKTIWCDFSSSDIESNEIESKVQTVAERKRELKDLEYKWGIQDCIEDYDFLEATDILMVLNLLIHNRKIYIKTCAVIDYY